MANTEDEIRVTDAVDHGYAVLDRVRHWPVVVANIRRRQVR